MSSSLYQKLTFDTMGADCLFCDVIQLIRFFAFNLWIVIVGLGLTISTTYGAQVTPSQYFESIKSQPRKLISFLKAMPKGADLHIHPSGATYAENLLRYAAKDTWCVDRETYAVSSDETCKESDRLNQAIKQPKFYHQLVDAWSMRHFKPTQETGHDHFFNAFKKFSPIVKKHRFDILSEIAARAESQRISYLELLSTGDNNASGLLGKELGWDPDFATMRNNLLKHNIQGVVQQIVSSVDEDEAGISRALQCQTKPENVGCHIKIRYLYQVLREQDPEMVFAQLLAGFEAAHQDSRVVGLNIVQPEDGKIALRDYALHMKMIGFFRSLYPHVPVSLHAGELSRAVVSPRDLTFHIHDAVYVAQANRIGHGVDILNEKNNKRLLSLMAKKPILVEINLSSNFSILSDSQAHHPLSTYQAFRVPLALSTDDEGINRSDLTHEYKLAVEQFHLDYNALKTFARNSLTYSFLPGKTLWSDVDYYQIVPDCSKDTLGLETPSPVCHAFLAQNEKAAMQWQLEQQFRDFEQRL